MCVYLYIPNNTQYTHIYSVNKSFILDAINRLTALVNTHTPGGVFVLPADTYGLTPAVPFVVIEQASIFWSGNMMVSFWFQRSWDTHSVQRPDMLFHNSLQTVFTVYTGWYRDFTRKNIKTMLKILLTIRPVTITTFCCAIYCPRNNCDKRYYCHFKTILYHWIYVTLEHKNSHK